MSDTSFLVPIELTDAELDWIAGGAPKNVARENFAAVQLNLEVKNNDVAVAALSGNPVFNQEG